MILVEVHENVIMTANIMIASDMTNVIMIVVDTIIAKTSILTDTTRIEIIARFPMEISTIVTRIARKKIMRCM
jgi:hypothetical protein